MSVCTAEIKMKELKIAINEARRFLTRAKVASTHLKDNDAAYGRAVAATKRASLDLTMALEDLRSVL